MKHVEAALAIDRLPRCVRRCGDLVHIEGLLPAAVARRLTLPLSAVVQHLETDRQARMVLAQAMAERYNAIYPSSRNLVAADDEAPTECKQRRLGRNLEA